MMQPAFLPRQGFFGPGFARCYAMKQVAPTPAFAAGASGSLARWDHASAEARAYLMSDKPLGPANAYLRQQIESLLDPSLAPHHEREAVSGR